MEAKAILFTSLLLENRAVSESIYNTLDITIIANTTKDSGKDEFPLLPGLINKSQPVIHVSGAIKSNLLLGLENRIVYTIVDVIEDRCKLKQALVKDKKNPNLSLLAAAQTRDKSAVSAEQLKDICEKLKEENDFVLVDCPAGIEQGFQNAVAGASEAIVVTTPEMAAIRDADRIIGLLESKEEIKSYKLLLNRVRPNLIKSNEMMSVEDVTEILACPLIGIIPEDTGIITSTNKGEPIVNDENALAGKAYRNVAQRVLGEEVPFLDLDEPKGFMAKIKDAFAKLKAKV